MVFLLLASLFFAAPVSDDWYVVFLRPDPARKVLPKEEATKLQAAHMAHISKMAQDGVLRAAGPFEDAQTTISGIFILRGESQDAVRQIAEQDPTVLAHRNAVEIHTWKGPKGIGDEYFRLHAADPKTPEDMAARPFFLLYRTGHGALDPVAHQHFLDKLKAEGKLAAGGPVISGASLVDIVVFRPGVTEDAARILAEDPAIRSGALRAEAHRWWCAAHVLSWE